MNKMAAKTTTLHVGRIEYASKKEDIEAIFKNTGYKELKWLETPIGMSKGYCFVEYETEEAAKKAIAETNDKEVNGRKIVVQISRPHKKTYRRYPRFPRYPRYPGYPTFSGSRRRYPKNNQKQKVEKKPSETNLFVKNIPYATTEEEFKKVFEKYNCEEVKIVKRRNGSSKGYGFVTLKSHADQEKAIKELEGTKIGEREIKISAAYEKLQTEEKK